MCKNRRLPIVFFLLLTMGCDSFTTGDVSHPKAAYRVGETVYVCGCSGCTCSIVARVPGGTCACNLPLQQGTVVRTGNGTVTIQVGRRQKVLFQ